ncbi:MAG TPA: hypothetical protein VFY26_05920 [Anaerolineales bacterium]|nr:hypothetical protein [Anaerolineales bacterium]
MGLSSTSALVGLVVIAFGVFFFIRKQRSRAILLWIIGAALIFVPFSLIYLLLD